MPAIKPLANERAAPRQSRCRGWWSGRDIPIRQFTARKEACIGRGHQKVKHAVEFVNAMWHRYQMRMQADREANRAVTTFLLEAAQRELEAPRHLARRVPFDRVDD